MKKVKLKVSHHVLCILSESLHSLINNNTDKTLSGKIYLALWIECWLIIQHKAAFKFDGEENLSLSVSRGLALMCALHLFECVAQYEQVLFLQLIAQIDKQTA